jgi:hypothetical protein
MIHSTNLTRTLIAIIATCLSITPAACPAEDQAEEGFVSLFDGETLEGWHLMNDAKFVVEDGVIKLNGGSGWLRSDKEFTDFILRLELRFMKPKQDGGVFLRSSIEGENWPNQKYEVQCENTNRMAKIFGAEHDLNVELTKQALKPDGEWNAYDIKLIGSTIEVRLNGELVSSSEKMDQLKSGYLGFQGENGFHEYRHIRIKDLSGADPSSTGAADVKQLFDGETLKGWRGNSDNWSVKDGMIVGSTLPSGLRENTFLIADGEYKDFILKLKFKHSTHASGIQFRSRMLGKPEEFRVTGYQADIGGGDTGTFYEEQGRGTLAPADAEVIARHYREGEWNTYEIKAIGDNVELKINDHVTARYTEKNPDIPRSGSVALQLQAGAIMTIYFKNIELQEIKR